MTSLLMNEFAEDFALFIEAGFVAVKQLDESSATRLFNAAQILRPESVVPKIGLGYIALNKLEMRTATQIFEEVVKAEPDNTLAQTFLGMCYVLNKAKRKQGEQLIQDAMGKTDDPTVKSLGAIALEWSEKDLSKSKSPFFNDNRGT